MKLSYHNFLKGKKIPFHDHKKKKKKKLSARRLEIKTNFKNQYFLDQIKFNIKHNAHKTTPHEVYLKEKEKEPKPSWSKKHNAFHLFQNQNFFIKKKEWSGFIPEVVCLWSPCLEFFLLSLTVILSSLIDFPPQRKQPIIQQNFSLIFLLFTAETENLQPFLQLNATRKHNPLQKPGQQAKKASKIRKIKTGGERERQRLLAEHIHYFGQFSLP